VEWKIQASLPARPAERAAAEQLAAWLRERGWIPSSQYRDSLIIAEASIARVPLLVTTDPHFFSDNGKLALSFSLIDARPVAVYRPSQLVRFWLTGRI